MCVLTQQGYLSNSASQCVGSILGAEDTAVNKMDEHLFLHEAKNQRGQNV